MHRYLLLIPLLFLGFSCNKLAGQMENRTETFDTPVFILMVHPDWNTRGSTKYIAALQNYTSNDPSHIQTDDQFYIEFIYGFGTGLPQPTEAEFSSGITSISTVTVAGKPMQYGKSTTHYEADTTSLGYVERYFLDDPNQPILITVVSGSQATSQTLLEVLNGIQWK